MNKTQKILKRDVQGSLQKIQNDAISEQKHVHSYQIASRNFQGAFHLGCGPVAASECFQYFRF